MSGSIAPVQEKGERGRRGRRGRGLPGPLLVGLLLAPLWAGTGMDALAAQDGPPTTREPFTVEEVLSAPFPSELVADPSGEAFAWVQNDRGERNLWVARALELMGERVTAYSGDDGKALGDLAFTPDGTRLVFVRGGAPNRQGEIPNPRSDPAGAERTLWVVPVEGGDPRRLAEGSAPAVSPTGDRVAFLRGGDVWSVGLDGEAEPERLARLRGSASSLRWSPDGSRLAFVSSRGTHSFIGVLDPDGEALRYLDPDVDRDSNPVWSPDGTRIAFLRIPNERDVLPFFARREGIPWSIRVVDAETGEAREVWRASEGTGSVFRGISAESQLFWGAGDRIVFPWEGQGQGWTHLWSVPVAGGEPTHLTPGPFEVQFVAPTPDGRDVIFSSNQDDVDRQHLWRVAVSGGEAVQLTPGEGIEWSPVPAGEGDAVAFLASGARTPAHPALLTPEGERRPLVSEVPPDGFPSGALVEPEAVSFPASDGLEIRGQLFRPPDLAPGERRPGVLFFHGGSRRQMLLGFHHREYYHHTYAFNQYLASRGFVVLSVNFRSGIGYGMEFREALEYGAGGASEFSDVTGAALYLGSRPEVDPDRIGLWGGSYGGYLTALGLARASDLFVAGVDVHGVHDWNAVIRNFVPDYDPTARPEVARTAFESSPLADVERWRSPVLLIHGDDDRNVPFSESVDLAEDLRRGGVHVETLVFPDEVHGFLLHRNWTAALEAAGDFFWRKLGGAGEAGG